MKDTRIELKVGIFVATGLVLLALLVLSFSRGLTLFERTYKLHIVLPNSAGLKPSADVMMSGVPIGKAYGMELLPDSRSVTVNVRLLSKYKIRTNAVFHVDALGFLGDQYIAVTPSTNLQAAYLQNGDMVQGESPFDLQEAVRSVADLLDQAKKTVMDVNLAIKNVNGTVLSPRTLTNVSLLVSNLETMSDAAAETVRDAKGLIQSNTPAVNAAVANLRGFSEKLDLMGGELNQLVETNRPAVDETLRNLRDTSASFKQVAADLEAGKGLAGGLLKDEEMKAQVESLISNANTTAAALSTFGSNLNKKGIWSMLWKPKHTEKREESQHPAP